MSLSSDLVAQFVKATNDSPNKKQETTLYGTIVTSGNTNYVRLDGSEILTPISSTTTASDGDRVAVMVKDHSAVVTGNISDPAQNGKSTDDKVASAVSEFEIIIADKVSTKELDAQVGRIDNLVAENITIKDNLTANSASIDDLTAKNVTVEKILTANSADIEILKTSTITAEDADLKYATIENLNVANETVHNLSGDYASFKETTTTDFSAVNARIDHITGTDITTEFLDANYAQIDLANIATGSIKSAMIEQGAIGTVQIADGSITDAKIVGLTANKITTGRLDAATIEVVNLNAANITVGTINGQQIAQGTITTTNIAENTITADNLAADCVIAEKILAESITGAKIAAKTITANNMVANTITAASGIIADAAITNAKIETLDASKITSGYISADRIKAGSITADKITVTDLQAIGATIGGFTIRQDSLTMGGTYLADDASHFFQADCIYIGKSGISYNNTFCIRSDGSLLSQNPSVSTSTCMINSGSINFGISGKITMSYVNPGSGYNTPQIASVLYFGVESTTKGPITVSNLVNGKVNIVANGGMNGHITMKADATAFISAPYINLYSDDVSVKNIRIVARGSNGNGEYIRFYDGTQICVAKRTFSWSATNSYGSLYESETRYNLGTWPASFLSTPYISIGLETGTTGIVEPCDPNTIAIGSTYMYRPTSIESGLSTTLSIIGIGRWK